MYTVMVVEDECIERQALILMLRNNFSELSVVAEAGNGIDAINLARLEKPDLVLVDVGIPGINGLEVIAVIKNEQPKTSFIIVSSYDNFEYAQRAIKLGVEDYLLKPTRLETLRQAVNASIARKKSSHEADSTATKLLNRMESIRPLVEHDFIYEVIANGQAPELFRMLAFWGLEDHGGFCLIISEKSGCIRLHGMIKNALEEVGNKLVSGFFNNQSILCVMIKGPVQNDVIENICGFIQEFLKKQGYGDYNIGVSKPLESAAGWPNAYRQARIALKNAMEENIKIKNYDIPGQLSPAGPSSENLKIWSKMLVRAVLEDKDDQLKKLTGQIALFLLSDNEFQQAREEAYKMMILLEQELGRTFPTLGSRLAADAAILELEQPRHLETALLSYIKQFGIMIQDFRDQNKNSFVDNALLYIYAHYQKEISLGSVAKEIGVSPFYLSKLLHRHTNKTCTELIAEQRIEMAKKLLLQNYSSKEVCYQVGFNSQNYFAKIFKKFTGLTPGEFRNISVTETG
ncbi:MAG: response regulator [Treponema sp.]|nr:response regulator [Treponema sp.]MCL2126652.1 response regulator [Treponema sp.]